MPKVNFNLYLITNRLNLPPGTDLPGQVEAALRGGARAVQLREKDLGPEELLPLAQELRTLTSAYDAKLFINSCLETALAVSADGIHLPASNPPVADARRRLGQGALIGVSTHTIAEISAASRAGADFVTFGPVYPTPSKISLGTPVGVEKLRSACAGSHLPVFALGGITADRLPELVAVGCTHFACISTILNAGDPTEAARRFVSP